MPSNIPYSDEEIERQLQEDENRRKQEKIDSMWDVQDSTGKDIQYRCKIMGSTTTVSRKGEGDPMIVLDIMLFKADGAKQELKYFMVFPENPQIFIIKKRKDCYLSCGMKDFYEKEKEFEGTELVGKQAVVTCKYGSFNNEPQFQIDKFIRPENVIKAENDNQIMDDAIPF